MSEPSSEPTTPQPPANILAPSIEPTMASIGPLVRSVLKDADEALKNGDLERLKLHQVEIAKILKMLADAGIKSDN